LSDLSGTRPVADDKKASAARPEPGQRKPLRCQARPL